MIVKCINDQSEKHFNYLSKLTSNKLPGLTKDKLYEAEQSKEYEGYFDVINDLGIKESYKKERFEDMEVLDYKEEYKKLKEENEKLNIKLSDFSRFYLQNGDFKKEKENEELKAEINQLRDDIQQSNFKLKEYESKLPQLKELIIKLVDINKFLASNIYVEGLEE
ncbi:hypothetical protein [Clostridium beijerinckii]|uniref:hypothetical protein n=1 Tax=Clostridium beijerinckii TaxID=1520 RepID=UPI00047CCE88|nr:hypothetical protein [Clostridium beijerinckii]